MKQEDFDKVLGSCLDSIRATLLRKGAEYAADNDRLHNFKVAAAYLGITPEKALMGMLAKHLVSVRDIANDPGAVPPDVLHEKVIDSINYLILLEAAITERRWWKA